ncbi:amidohydrolase [bacterium]|nr:MAG: amidohydrolase [bacterium]
MNYPEILLHNGQITTHDVARPEVSALAISGGLVQAIGGEELLATAGPQTRVVDLKGRRAIPGLNDSHIHVIRGGLNYNMELRWDGVPSLADALRMLRDQAARTPAPQWVRVVGGWGEFQFAEKRMPSLDEINAASGDVPVFVLHLYDRALLNRAALHAVGYDRNTVPPPGCEIQHDAAGNPTGMLIARPNALILYKTLALGPKLSTEDQLNSSRQFMRELNRFGLTSAVDAGGGFQNYPEDYSVIEELHRRGQMTLRIAYNLFAQKPGSELEDYKRWVGMVKPGDGDQLLRMNGAGENMVWAAADFEDFLEPRPELALDMEDTLYDIVHLLAQNRWPWRIHATYDESISRFLDVFERVEKEVPFDGIHWFIDHAETVSQRNVERVKALGGGFAIQCRMAFQGEYFVDRYGAQKAEQSPPMRYMRELNVPVGAGTDATRVASYNPWVSLYWMTTGKTVGGTALYPQSNRFERGEALRLYTQGSAWFSSEEAYKGALVPGQLADVAVLSADYFSVPDEEIKGIESVLTLLGGVPVYAVGDFSNLSPLELPYSPDWAPARYYGGWGAPGGVAFESGRTAALVEEQHGLRARIHAALHSFGNQFADHSSSGSCPVHRSAAAKEWDNFDAKRWWNAGCTCWAF